MNEIHNLIRYYGDSVVPNPGEHDIRALVEETMGRLPADVREWLLEDASHVFLCGSGQDGEYIELAVHPFRVRGRLRPPSDHLPVRVAGHQAPRRTDLDNRPRNRPQPNGAFQRRIRERG